MSTTQVRSETAIETPRAQRVDMKLEVVVIPVSDVERAKRFYGGPGWKLDAEFAAGADFRVIQFTPPGSGCSVIFGKNVTAAAPGSAQGLYLIVSDIEAAREIIHCILDLMYAKAPCAVMQRAMHIHPTVSELIPTMMGDLVPLQ